MGGFKNETFNTNFRSSLFQVILDKLIVCSKLMYDDKIKSNMKIENDENKIRNRLLEGYLDNERVRKDLGIDLMKIRFMPEVQENYNENTTSYEGRVDIKVVTQNWLASNKDDYYTIECKRIDGYSSLNKKYILEGIVRFVREPVKYNSHNDENIMFGFVVRSIDIGENTKVINEIHNFELNDIIIEELKCNCECQDYHRYSSKYNVTKRELRLEHLFYDFSNIVL